jgi:ADP-ribose pyrophosphatase
MAIGQAGNRARVSDRDRYNGADGQHPKANPWRTLSSKLRYENAWIALTQHEVLNPKGGPGIYGVVHYKNLAIGVLPVDDEGNTWLVGQYRYPTGHYTWEIPEGGGDPLLDPLVSAERELREETGIQAARWRLLLHMELSNSVSDELAFVYLATGLTHGASSPEETEALTLRRLPLLDATAMALDGRITDSVSVAALLRAKVELDAGTLLD